MAVETSEVVDMIRKGDKLGVMVYLRYGGDPNARNHMGWTLLHLACVEGQTDIVEVLLDAGASVNSCTTDMSTPLHRACTQGYKTVVELLLKKNAYINAQDKAGNTPLHEAARGFHTAIVKMLIDKKADKTKANRKNQLFLQLVGQQLMPAVETGDAEVIMQWLDWGVSPDTKGNLHWSILHHASARGQLNIVSLLIERGGNVNVEDSNKTTPLHTACFHGHLRIASLLIDSNANINATDQRGNTPLHSAIEGSHPDLINLLLERGCDTTIANKEGQIFTHLVNEFLVTAVHASKIGQVTSLLKGRADPNTRDAYGCPVLCHAAFKGDMIIAEALLEAGADPDLNDEAGKTPLHHAAYWGHLFVLKALLDMNATVNVSDKNGSTPLHEAAREGVEDVITVLTGRGAKINATDEDGNTPLHAAGKWGQVTTVQFLIEKGAFDNIKNKNGLLYSDLALIRAVRTEEHTQVMSGLAWGGDPNSRDARGWTLLHHAVYKGAHDICLLLLECGANVNAADTHDRTPLLLAAYRGNHQIMQVLLDEGADINAQDWSGETPLHWAANEGSVDTVQLLLDHGADTNVKNKAGLLYSDLLLKHLYLAVRHKDADKVVKLVSAGANQFAEVEGIGLNPREEAKRQGLYDILRQMAALAKKDSQPEDDKIIALEDVYKLFEDGYITGDVDSISSEEEEASEVESAEDSDNEEDAYWKMSNAYEILTVKEAFQEDEDDWLSIWEEKPKVISAKELFEEDQAAFWEFWEETPKAIPAKEFFKEESNWWEDDEDGDDNKEGKADDSKIISAKEFFRDDECWWRDAVEDLEKPKVISAKEFFSDERPWWEDGEEEQAKVLSAKEFFKEDNLPWWESEEKTEVLPAKEFFKDDNPPWWQTGEEALGHANPGDEEGELRKKSPDVAHSISYHSSFREEESEYADSAEVVQQKEGKDNGDGIESSDGEADESNIADSFEDATDSVFSDSSNMYSASEGERLQASSEFGDTPWWEEVGKDGRDRDMLKASEAYQEEHWLDSMGEVSEGTETLDMDSSEISGMAAALEASQVATWLQDDTPCTSRVKRSKRSDMHKMKTEMDTDDEDSEVKVEGKEERVKGKIEKKEGVERRRQQNRLEKQGEENEICEDGAEGMGDKESSCESEEIKSEDEMDDISDEELDAMELENEDEAAEHLTNVRDVSPAVSPVLSANVDWDNIKTCPGIVHGITPLVQVNMYETESDTTKFRTGDGRETETNHKQAQETPLDLNVDVVSKQNDLEKEATNVDREPTNTDSLLLDPNQLSIYGHYMEGTLQKSDSQTSGYESSLSLSECAHQNKSSDNKTSVVKKNHDRSVHEKLADTRHNDRTKPLETTLSFVHNDRTKLLETTVDTGYNDRTKPLETTVDPGHNVRTKPLETTVDSGHNDRTKPLETTVDPGHNDRTKPLETTVDTGHNDRTKPLETTLDPGHNDRTKPLETTADPGHNDRTKPSETPVDTGHNDRTKPLETTVDAGHNDRAKLKTKVNIQDNNLERTSEIDVDENSEQVSKGHSITEQGNKRQDTAEQVNKRKADITQCEENLVAKKQIDTPDVEHLGIIKHENDQIIESPVSEETQDAIDHSSVPKVMNEKGSQSEALGNVTRPKTYAAAVKENAGDKITVNKMDACLAKVDASLAWVDARLTKDSNGKPSHRNSSENLGERARTEDVRTFMTRLAKEGGSVMAPEYLGRGKSLKPLGNDVGSKTLDKSKGDEDTVLLMKVHVHVPGEGSCVMVSEANSLTNQGSVSQSKLATVADNKFPGRAFLGVVNNGNSDSKKFTKYIPQATELADLEKVNTSSSKENDQNASTKMRAKTNVMTEQDPIVENSPKDEEETSKNIKVETTQVIDLTEKTCTLSEDLQNNEEAVGKKTLEMASGPQSNEDGNTTHEALSSNSEKDNYRGNEQPSELRSQSKETDDDTLDEQQERASREVADDSATGTSLDNRNGSGYARENSVERSLPKHRSELPPPPPSPQKTIWRCSTYEAMSLSDYDNLAFLIRQTSSCPDCWSGNKRREWSVSIESLDKAGDGPSETSSDTSTSSQKQYHSSDPVRETFHDEGRTSRSSVDRDEHRINVDEVSSSRGHCHVDKNNTETCERSEDQLNVLSDRDSLVEDVPQVNVVLKASSVSLPNPPAQAEAQARTNCSENSSDPDPLPVPPRTKERKLSSQTVIQKVPGYSAESQSTNALKEPTNTALLYNPDKKDVGKVVAASQVWPDVPQAHQGATQTRSEVKLDKMKPNELVVMAGKMEPVRKSSSCRIS